MSGRTPRTGILAEFRTPEEMLAALGDLRARGLTRLDTFTPYPVEGVEEALALRRSSIPWWAFWIGLAGAVSAFAIQWWTNAVDYPIVVGGRPLNSIPAWIPITFETTVLCASLATFLVLCVKARLTALWHPVFEVPGFESAQVDRFWVMVGDGDERYEERVTVVALQRAGASRVVRVEGEE
jgi:hypothetical protein